MMMTMVVIVMMVMMVMVMVMVFFGSRPLRCGDNEILKKIMKMTMVVMVMMVMVMVTERKAEFPNSIYHNSRSTAPLRRY